MCGRTALSTMPLAGRHEACCLHTERFSSLIGAVDGLSFLHGIQRPPPSADRPLSTTHKNNSSGPTPLGYCRGHRGFFARHEAVYVSDAPAPPTPSWGDAMDVWARRPEHNGKASRPVHPLFAPAGICSRIRCQSNCDKQHTGPAHKLPCRNESLQYVL